MSTPTIGERLHDWTSLNNNLKPLLAELPHLAPLQAELEEIIAESKRLEVQQHEATARLRQVNEERARAAVRGQRVKERIADLLRSHFGTKSIALLQYGIRPLTGGPRRRKAAPAPEPVPEAET
jgi:hypothetical protein